MFIGDKFKIKESVYYTQVDDFLYVRDVASRKDYKLNLISEDIFQILKEETKVEDLLKKLSLLYNVKNDTQFHNEITSFLSKLSEKGLVSRTDESSTVKLPIIKEEVEEYCQKNKRMWGLGLELTYRCNERCIHCYVPQNKKNDQIELSLEEIKDIITQARKLGCMDVLVTGGEPTLRKDFLSICKHIVAERMLLNVFTNALAISEEVFSGLISLPVNSVSFSLYGRTPAFHDSITGVKGSFDASLKNILMFKSAGIDVFVKTIAFNNHIDEYEKLDRFCKQIGISVRPASLLMPKADGSSNKDLMMDEKSAARFFKYEFEKNQQEKISVAMKRGINSPVCSAGLSSLSVNPYGEVTACNSLPIAVGNIRKQSLADIWYSSKELERIRKIRFSDLGDKCVTCDCSSLCGACLGAMYLENNKAIKPCEYMCRFAKLRKENRIEQVY